MDLLPQPKIEPWMDEDEILFRKQFANLIPKLNNFISQDFKFLGYLTEGISSVVGVAEVDGVKTIVKSTRWPQNLSREATFLRAWSEQNVRVPKIIDILEHEGIAAMLMEYIPEATAFKHYEKNPSEDHGPTWEYIGTSLAKMHRTSAIGFAKPSPPDFKQGKYTTLKEYLDDKLLPPESVQTLKGFGVMTEKISKFLKDNEHLQLAQYLTVLGHNDLGLHNILGTGKDSVVFDPDPTITHPYFDLAVSHIWAISQSTTKESDLLLEAYQAEGGEINLGLYKYFLLLRLLSKQANWIKRDSELKIPITKELLEKTPSIFDFCLS